MSFRSMVLAAGVASLTLGASAAWATTITTLDGSQGWGNTDTRPDGQISIGPIGGQNALVLEVHTVTLGNDKAAAGINLLSSPPGTLGDLSSFTFDWYRDGSSDTVNALQAPALRLYVLNSNNEVGQLVWELSYDTNAGPAAQEDAWVTQDLFAAGNRIWARVNNANHDTIAEMQGLADWVGSTIDGYTFDANSQIIGIEASIGSYVNGDLLVGVDNIALGFAGGQVVQTYEFGEDAVASAIPEPATAALGMMTLVGLAMATRRRRA